LENGVMRCIIVKDLNLTSGLALKQRFIFTIREEDLVTTAKSNI